MKYFYLPFVVIFALFFAFSVDTVANDRIEKIPLNTDTTYFSESDPVVALYHLHSGEPLPDGSELAEAFATIYGYTDYKRFAQEMSRTSDAFAIRDMEEDLKSKVLREIDELKSMNTFAISGFRMSIEPYDFEEGGYVLCCFRSKGDERDGYITGMGVGNYLMQYKLPNEKFGYRIDEGTARNVEAIFAQRKSRSLSTNTHAIMHFEVERAEKQTIRRQEFNMVTARPVRLEIVDDLKEFQYGAQSNYKTLMSIDLTELK